VLKSEVVKTLWGKMYPYSLRQLPFHNIGARFVPLAQSAQSVVRESWVTLLKSNKITNRRISCRKKDDRVFYGKRYKIIVGSATDIGTHLSYSNVDIFFAQI